MLHRGTQPTAPSRQVHWYLQLLWKDSPLLYTVPPKTQGAPSLAEEEEGKKGGLLGSGIGPRSCRRAGHASWEQGWGGVGRAGGAGNSQRKGLQRHIFWLEGGREGGGGGSLSVPAPRRAVVVSGG